MRRMTRHAWSIAAMCLLAVATSSIDAQASSATPTTVILVRHAEKAAAPAADPPLSAAGEARGKALLDAVREAGVSAIITTQYVRTRATAAPTATALGITPEVVPATGSSHVQDVADAIRKHQGQTVLVVGHSNTIPEIIRALGAAAPPICDAEYDNLFVLVLPNEAPPRLVKAKFGERTAVTDCASMK